MSKEMLDGSAKPLTEPSAQCTVETAKVYKLRKFRPESFCWADITIRSWKGGGSIDAQSDYGNYSYMWNATGCDDIRDFLLRLDYGYFMTKAHPSRGYETDWDATAKAVKRLILEARRRDGMKAEEARVLMEAAESVEWGESIFYEMRDYPELAQFYTDQDYPRETTRQGQCNGFWNIVWPEICKVWRKEMILETRSVGEASEPSKPVTPELPHPGQQERTTP